MRHLALMLMLCGSLSACSFWQEATPDEIMVAEAVPTAPAIPDSFCQRIARQDAAPYFTAITQRGIYERSYAQCSAMLYGG